MKFPPGVFVSDEPMLRKVMLGDGSVHDMHFMELPASEIFRFGDRQRSEDEQTRVMALPYLIAASLCDETGKPVLTADQASKLKIDVAKALAGAIMTVCRVNLPEAEPEA